MKIVKDNRGVTAFAIMLLALLALSVVLLNGISISINQKKVSAKTGLDVALSFCQNNHTKHPSACKITRVYQCASNYILRSGCVGVGDIVLNSTGNYVDWCGYTALDGESAECGSYLLDELGNDCTLSKNLCL